MIRILSGDLLMADIIVPLEDNPLLVPFIEEYRLVPGGKMALADAGLQAFMDAIEGHAVHVVPGGSSANMLTTLCRLLRGQVQARFLGVAGQGPYSGLIAGSLAEAGVTLAPQDSSGRAAVSFVIVFPSGQCTIATHPGNARELLTAEMITPEMMQESDIVLAQGSLWHKLDGAFPDRLVQLAKIFGRALWLTLPTQTPLTQEAAAHFKEMLPQADLVFGNEAELLRLFPGTMEAAMAALQQYLAGATGFITLGKEGAVIVTAHTTEHVPPEGIDAGDIVNTLGAGDTSYAGFAAGFLKGLSAPDSAHIAMALAAEKLRINQPRLPDPMKSLCVAVPELAVKLGLLPLMEN